MTKSNCTLTVNGVTFETAQLVDSISNLKHDITVIFKHNESDSSIEFVNYYFGEPDLVTTAKYIDTWFNDQFVSSLTNEYRREGALGSVERFTEWLDELKYDGVATQEIDHMTIKVGERAVHIPFHADSYEMLVHFLNKIIEQW